MSDYRTFKPGTMLSPTPAVLISCKGKEPDAKPNAVTLAWVGTVNSEPPMVSVSIRKERYSHPIVEETGEFVVNLVGEDQCRAMDYCGVRSGRDGDKLAACGLSVIPAENMQYAPAIDGCPVYMSCKVRQQIPLGSHDMFIGEVVGVQVRDDLFDADGSLHLERAGLVCYTHGVYQKAAEVLGFFGYSVARPEVLERRMAQYK